MFSKDTPITAEHTPDERGGGLWKSFLNGNLKAWEQIFTLFYEDLYAYGLKLSTQPELTKDCIHELFVKLWERREYLDEAVSVKAYLLTSMRRSLLKKIQKKRKYYKELDSMEMSPSERIQFSPEEIIINDEIEAGKIQALYEAIDTLPDRQKEVLYLKYFNGMSYDEIEAILSINYQSIRNHIHRAVKRLQKLMNENSSVIAISLLPILLSYAAWIW